MAGEYRGEPTPDRKTVVKYDVGGTMIERPSISMTRQGYQIGTGLLPTQPKSHGMFHAPNGWWSLIPHARISYLSTLSEFHHTHITADQVVTTANIKQVPVFRQKGTYLFGVPETSGMVSSGVPAFQRHTEAGSSFSEELTGDLPYMPKPPEDPPDFNHPIPRVIIGNEVCPANMGFSLAFGLPQDFSSTQVLFRFYWGGTCSVFPQNEYGGVFCWVLYADGRSKLFERNTRTKNWIPRDSFSWCAAGDANGDVFTLWIVPWGSEGTLFGVKHAEIGSGADTILGIVRGILTSYHDNANFRLFKDIPAITGHKHLRTQTGAGIIRCDVSSIYQQPFIIRKVAYPTTGLLVDGILDFPDLPEGTPFDIQVTYYNYPGDGIDLKMYRADNNEECPKSLGGVYSSIGGVRHYYVTFELTPTGDQYFSPIIISYSVTTPRTIRVESYAAITGGELIEVNASGPDLEPDQETCHLEVRDPHNQLGGLLLNRTRIRTWVEVRKKSDDSLITRLFDGETSQHEATRMGRATTERPVNRYGYSPMWFDYDIPLIGQWARIADQVNIGTKNYADSGDRDIDGRPLPWQITSIIRDLLNDAGFADGQILIPEYLDGIRLWYSPDMTRNDFSLMPGASYIHILQRLCKDYLGHVLCWDANSQGLGVGDIGIPLEALGGAWRLIQNPSPDASSLWTFKGQRPDVSPGVAKLVTAPGTWGAGATYIVDHTFKIKSDAPEFNYLSVSTAGQLVPNDDGSWMRYSNSILNKPSIYDRTHPDYLGRWVPAHLVDPFLGGSSSDPEEIQRAVDLAMVRLYDFAGHKRTWFNFQAPLVFVNDGDSRLLRERALRVNDPVNVGSLKCVVRSCSPAYRSGKNQVANYQVKLALPSVLP